MDTQGSYLQYTVATSANRPNMDLHMATPRQHELANAKIAASKLLLVLVDNSEKWQTKTDSNSMSRHESESIKERSPSWKMATDGGTVFGDP